MSDPTPRGPEQQSLELLIESSAATDLVAAASDQRLTEYLALMLLERRDLPARALELLAKNGSAAKHRKVIVGIVTHPATPRFVSLPIARRLFTFELVKIAMTPSVASDVKKAADDAIISRMESISAGERLALAKQGSTAVAAALLNDPEDRIVEAALNNPRMTENEIVRALKQERVSQALIAQVCVHMKWSLRTEIQIGVLKAEHTPLAKAILMADRLPPAIAAEVLRNSRMPDNVRAYLVALAEKRKQRSETE